MYKSSHFQIVCNQLKVGKKKSYIPKQIYEKEKEKATDCLKEYVLSVEEEIITVNWGWSKECGLHAGFWATLCIRFKQIYQGWDYVWPKGQRQL